MRKPKLIMTCLILFFISLFSNQDANAQSNVVNPNQVYTYNEMVRDIKKLQQAYPDLVKVKVIGKSEYNRNIYAFSVGKGDATLFINGSHHAREWLTTNLNMYMAEQYAIAYRSKKKINGYDAKKILDSTTIWFVPMVNPDGVTLQQEGLKSFPSKDHKAIINMNNGSKNFKRWKANAKGVDLNRQYDAGWKQIKSPVSPTYKNYKGKAPATAAETKAILKFTEEINPEMAIAYHSSGKILYWNYKQNTKNYNRDHVYAKEIRKQTGYSLVYPGKNPSGGGFTDWFIEAKKRPGFTPEIGRYAGETNLPVSEFTSVWSENKAVGLYLAQEGSKLYQARLGTTIRKAVADAKHKMWLPYKEFSRTGEQGPSKEPVWASTVQKKINEANAAKAKAEKLLASYTGSDKTKLQGDLKYNQKYMDNAKKYIYARWAGDDLLNKNNWDGAVKTALTGDLNQVKVKGKTYSDVRDINNLYFDFDRDIQNARKKIGQVWNRGKADTRYALKGYYTEPAYKKHAVLLKHGAWAVHNIEKAEWWLDNPQFATYQSRAESYLQKAYKDLSKFDHNAKLKKLIQDYYKATLERYEATLIIPDEEAPVLHYDGEQTINIENGAEFALPEVTGTDNVDELVEVTAAIKDGNGEKLEEIDTTIPGTYTITYSAKDQAGNTAKEFILTIVVKEAGTQPEPAVNENIISDPNTAEEDSPTDSEITEENDQSESAKNE
ncbi:DUF5011 domain-containing protein [Cytobacillus firmus]|uniref:M14 family zinc carboxypeptidase n=1 Tax=Cytobacillus firmus TaxID=1399 RepID=UPI002187EBBD|nr:M14 family zinc carboxypeptidase [Cytobacillus firmus]URM33411.1 DUF5011 domain-containing protein [Cytobacillus firmus]